MIDVRLCRIATPTMKLRVGTLASLPFIVLTVEMLAILVRPTMLFFCLFIKSASDVCRFFFPERTVCGSGIIGKCK